MITADTITDEQIRELHRRANEAGDWETVEWTLLALPSIARPAGMSAAKYDRLRHPSDGLRQRRARARCAETLNARAASKDGAK